MKFRLLILAALIAATLFSAACGSDDDGDDNQPPDADNVLEIAVRAVKADSLASFESARTAFINLLKAQEGVLADREFERIFSFTGDTNTVFVGMTEYESNEVYQQVAAEIGNSAEAGAFFGTFDPVVFTITKRIDDADPDLASLINTTNGQVLEIAVRDLNAYENFDQTDYEQKRDAFLEKLAEQPGFVSEHQFVSADDQNNYAVGMTVYDNFEVFQQINANADFVGGPEAVAFISSYPPAIYGGLHRPVN